ncbi:hypothetical protein [Hyphomicrobium sp. NDB2Meth4]|uniref:hypothetical protein n=1 Tax=Hyphomicrobium sp. NDB2Meth4 TaxID=1892846 RepID=UPI000A5A9997|nr:hypothetical protein [Hyphomicrobium sp. NDB2Meth4]
MKVMKARDTSSPVNDSIRSVCMFNNPFAWRANAIGAGVMREPRSSAFYIPIAAKAGAGST